MKIQPNMAAVAVALAEALDERADRKSDKMIAASEAREGVLQTYAAANAPRLAYAAAKKRFRQIFAAYRRARQDAKRGFTPTIEPETRDWLTKRGFEV